MARKCFCGCGRTIPIYMFGLRTYDTRGQQVVGRLVRIETLCGRDCDDRDLQQWFAEGEEIVGVIAEMVHRKRDPRTINEAEVRAWQVDGRAIERNLLSNEGNQGSSSTARSHIRP